MSRVARGLFRQKKPPNAAFTIDGAIIYVRWIGRTMRVRRLFDSAMRPLVSDRAELRRIRTWGAQVKIGHTPEEVRTAIGQLNNIADEGRGRDIAATFILYRLLAGALMRPDHGLAAELREMTKRYPEDVRNNAWMLHTLTNGLLTGRLVPADVDRVQRLAEGDASVLPRELVSKMLATRIIPTSGWYTSV